MQDVIDNALYGHFKAIDKFNHVTVLAGGLGLDASKLTKFARLKFKNNFTGISIDASENSMTANIAGMNITVRVVGDDFPVAYLVDLVIDNFDTKDCREYSNSVLGYGSKKNIEELVKNSINDLIEDSAIQFFRIRGEL